jgi:NAD(P)-dependent dehydrogenase (short-subunit alcohol dehydrogenase family)
MAGRACVVTGSTRGIGRATAEEFAREGARVILVARSEARGRAAAAEIIAGTGNTDVRLLVGDLSSQSSVRTLGTEFAQHYGRLDVLVNAAGVFVKDRQVTPDGFELMFATNQLGPFLLTLLLLPQLKAAGAARLVTVTAPSTVSPRFDDLQGERRFSPLHAFGASKAANLLFTFALARRLEGTGVTVNAYHPGIVRTSLMKDAPLPMRAMTSLLNHIRGQKPEDVAPGIVDAATSAVFKDTNGKLIHRGQVVRAPFEDDIDTQERLFRACEDLTGQRFPT